MTKIMLALGAFALCLSLYFFKERIERRRLEHLYRFLIKKIRVQNFEARALALEACHRSWQDHKIDNQEFDSVLMECQEIIENLIVLNKVR